MPAVATRKRTRKPTDDEIISAWESEQDYHLALRSDPILWAQIVCQIEPHKGQRRLLTAELDQPGSVWCIDWARQLGKGVGLATWLTWRCFSRPDFHAILLAPSGKQSGLLFDKCLRVLKNSAYIDRYVSWSHRGDTITIGGDDWNSTIRLVRCGLRGDLARGITADVLVFDETGYFTYLSTVRSAVTPSLAATHGSEIYLSSPTWTGSPWAELVRFCQEQEQLAKQQNRKSKYHHIPCDWTETNHITSEWVEQKRAEHERLGTLPEFRRDVLGEWCEPSERFFPDDQILPCIVDDLAPLRKSDQVLMSLDIGGRHSATVSLWGRYSPINRRVEVTNYHSFILRENRYLSEDDHTILDDHTQLIDAMAGLRFQYGNPSWAAYDPGNQETIPQLLEQSGWNVAPIRISSYPAKMSTPFRKYRNLAGLNMGLLRVGLLRPNEPEPSSSAVSGSSWSGRPPAASYRMPGFASFSNRRLSCIFTASLTPR